VNTQEDVAITVEHVSKSFRLPHERQSSLKGVFINILKGGKRSFEVQHVLKDVSFTIKKGEFFGIVGVNGSGKSTLLKMIAGIYEPNKGEIYVDGKLIPFIELGVGFNPELSGRENVFLNGALLGFNRKEVEAMYDDIVSFAELEKFMDQKLKNYSSGMQVRLAFSIAIKAQGDILLIDEVLAVGDARFQQKCFEYFYELKNSNRTVVFISHDLDSVERFCDNVILIEKGVITAAGDAQAVIDKYKLHNFEESKKDAGKKEKTGSVKKAAAGTIAIENRGKNMLKSGETLELSFQYHLLAKRKVELRLALVKDGVAFAHINTRGTKLPTSPGKYSVDLNLSTECLMDGQHEVYCGVFDADTEEELAFKTKAASFLITNSDPTRYGFMRIEGGWRDARQV
jgi:ABC-2 type transport system ATP-binding protein